MIAVANQHEALTRKLASEAFEKLLVLAHAESLASKIFVNHRAIAEILPFRSQFWTPAVIPREMIGGEINEEERRAPLGTLAFEHFHRGVVVEAVRLHIAST